MGGVNSRSDHERFSQMWLHVASSLSSHGHFLLSVPSVEIYRADLGTAAITTIYISKPEQVKVLAHSAMFFFALHTERSCSDASVSPPISVSKVCGVSEGKSRL